MFGALWPFYIRNDVGRRLQKNADSNYTALMDIRHITKELLYIVSHCLRALKLSVEHFDLRPKIVKLAPDHADLIKGMIYFSIIPCNKKKGCFYYTHFHYDYQFLLRVMAKMAHFHNVCNKFTQRSVMLMPPIFQLINQTLFSCKSISNGYLPFDVGKWSNQF